MTWSYKGKIRNLKIKELQEIIISGLPSLSEADKTFIAKSEECFRGMMEEKKKENSALKVREALIKVTDRIWYIEIVLSDDIKAIYRSL